MGNICGKQEADDAFAQPGRRLGSAPPPAATTARVPASAGGGKRTVGGPPRTLGGGGPSSSSRSGGAPDDARRQAAAAAEVSTVSGPRSSPPGDPKHNPTSPCSNPNPEKEGGIIQPVPVKF